MMHSFLLVYKGGVQIGNTTEACHATPRVHVCQLFRDTTSRKKAPWRDASRSSVRAGIASSGAISEMLASARWMLQMPR